MFDVQYKPWLAEQIAACRGERRRRLEEGHSHAEKLFLQNVWWPAVGSLEHLHAEYEVSDYRDGSRFLDYAYVRPHVRIAIEIDGFGPHARDADRRSFSDGLHRQNQLVLDDWKVFRFAYDDVKSRPRQCQQTIQQIMGRWGAPAASIMPEIPLLQREILRIAVRSGRPFTPADVSRWMRISRGYARKRLRQLCERGLVVPSSGNDRIRSYALHPSAVRDW